MHMLNGYWFHCPFFWEGNTIYTHRGEETHNSRKHLSLQLVDYKSSPWPLSGITFWTHHKVSSLSQYWLQWHFHPCKRYFFPIHVHSVIPLSLHASNNLDIVHMIHILSSYLVKVSIPVLQCDNIRNLFTHIILYMPVDTIKNTIKSGTHTVTYQVMLQYIA